MIHLMRRVVGYEICRGVGEVNTIGIHWHAAFNKTLVISKRSRIPSFSVGICSDVQVVVMMKIIR